MIQVCNKEYHYTEGYDSIWYGTTYQFKLKASIYNQWPEEIKTFIRSKVLEGMGFIYSPFQIDYDLEIKLFKENYIILKEMVSAYEEMALIELGRS